MELNFDKLFIRKENITYDMTKMILTYLNINQHHDSPINTCGVFANDDKDMYIYTGIFEFFSLDPLQEKDYNKIIRDNSHKQFKLNLAYAKAMLLNDKNLYINSIEGEHEDRFLVYTILWKLLSYQRVIIHHVSTDKTNIIINKVLSAYNNLPESIRDGIPNIESRLSKVTNNEDIDTLCKDASSSTFLMLIDIEFSTQENILTLFKNIESSASRMKFKFNWMIYSMIPGRGRYSHPELKKIKDAILPLQSYMLNHQDILDSHDSFYIRFDYNELGLTSDDINDRKKRYNNDEPTICQELYMLDYDKYKNTNNMVDPTGFNHIEY